MLVLVHWWCCCLSGTPALRKRSISYRIDRCISCGLLFAIIGISGTDREGMLSWICLLPILVSTTCNCSGWYVIVARRCVDTAIASMNDRKKCLPMEIFHNDWAELLNPELQKPYYRQLRQFLIHEYRTYHVYPDMYAIFNALHYTSYADTKVVILGQDPYHGPGQAHGLSFSVLPGIQPPPSLLNIFKELETDLAARFPIMAV